MHGRICVSPAAGLTLALALLLSVALAPAAGSGSASPDGKKLFAQKACTACHNVGAPSTGLCPELTQVAYQRDREWMRAWLSGPAKIKKDTIMPKPSWSSPEEMEAVIDYLLGSKRPIPDADSAAGEKLFQDYSCNSCHAIHKKGGKPRFSDLGDEAKLHDAAWLDRWLKDPQAVKKGTFMATFPLTDTQRKALVDYLLSLKK